jgi:hypothetical protein
MQKNLTSHEMQKLVERVFAPVPADQQLVILLDVPNEQVADNQSWRDRRMLAREWHKILNEIKTNLGLKQVELIYYENSGSNNADLPSDGFLWTGDPQQVTSSKLKATAQSMELHEILASADIILAPTEFSATAPLKVLARQHGFRAATMPGFSREMIPALGVDYSEVHRRVMNIKTRLDEAESAQIEFETPDADRQLVLDLRHRSGHASSGLLRDRGVAGNLPSGEAYIVPYEGDREEKSGSTGVLPVQFGDEIVLYEISENRAVNILSTGEASESERRKLTDEPAYGNLAELGFGVLAALGVRPVGETLLDEKLGLHIAFGRSDHFGGAVSPRDFRNPKNVIHIDRIYIPEVQNSIQVKEVVLSYGSGRTEVIMENGDYRVL